MSPSVDAALIQRFAPKVYLHPYDKNHPDAVENYFNTVFLKRDGVVLTTTVNAETLRQYNDEANYLEFASGRFPTAADDFETGAPIQPTAHPNVGTTTAPVYVKTFAYPTHIDIKYIFFYPFQGFQTFRAGILRGFTTRKRNFEWARFGRHEADWEHITVRLDAVDLRLRGVFYGQHGESVWVEQPPLVDETHPVVLSALNSHASYWTGDTFAKDDILRPPGLLPIGWLKGVDTTVSDGLVVYHPPQPLYTAVEWTPYKEPGQLVNLDENSAATPWLDFKGCWGPPKLDNTHLDRPPALPQDAEDYLFNWAKILTIAIPEKYFYGNGPRSPKQQGWWNAKEP
jgi:hypothetical protein